MPLQPGTCIGSYESTGILQRVAINARD